MLETQAQRLLVGVVARRLSTSPLWSMH